MNARPNTYHSSGMHNNSVGASHALHGQSLHQSGYAAHGLHAQGGPGARSFTGAHGLHGNTHFSVGNFNRANIHGAGLGRWNSPGGHNFSHFAGNRAYHGAWHGTRFHSYREAFGAYHRAYHDRYWWHDHYDRIAFVGGGYYYWDAGYWYPAWGYEPAFVNFVYDGPIYSYNNLPPDQVIVSVQDSLQDQGYYTGTVDGQLGPATRDAIGAFQRDHGLDVTAAVDEPTVQALGLTEDSEST